MTILQAINASASPEVQVNENFETLEFAAVYGKDPRTTQNLTWDYYGGRWGGFLVADGTLTLTDAATNYLSALRSTGALSVSTASTNWDNTALYARVYKLTTAGGVVTAVEDHRAGRLGIHGSLASVAGPVSSTDGMPAVFDGIDGQLLKNPTPAGVRAAIGLGLPDGLFRKADPATVAFVKTGAFTISTQAAALYVEINGVPWTIAASTAVTMPGSPAAGTDYAIWAKTDGTLEATANHVTPPTANARRIGGFHYAPGGNATGVAGGDTTPAINAYSIWDLKFRPACPDPRGMTLVADGFWADIYLLGVDHPTNGSSKYNATIADGSSPPKIPAKFGGNGTTVYGGGNWWDMHEVMRSFGKRFPNVSEFGALAYGTTEAASATAATDPTSTVLRAESTSKWGVMLSTGNMWIWGDEFGGGTGTAAWTANTGGRGSTYQLENAVLLGGSWGNGADSGSRCSLWNLAPTASNNSLGARGVCDHLQLD